jgi:tetratricopeptide (TPR) repeat protein
MSTFEQDILTANYLVNKQKYDEALSYYLSALDKTEEIIRKTEVWNTLGSLYMKLNRPGDAMQVFKQSLNTYEFLDDSQKEQLLPVRATVLNNLGVLILNKDPGQAVDYHKEALKIFETLNEQSGGQYLWHLANTQLSLANAARQKKDHYTAKKYYREAIHNYTRLGEDNETASALKADAHFNMGIIFSDENKMHDARSHFFKAVKIFRTLTGKNPKAYRPLLASALNNLGSTSKLMYAQSDAIKYYKQTLEEYEKLLEDNRALYLPYYAATLNSLGIIYAEEYEPKDDYNSGGVQGFSGFGILSIDNIFDEQKEKEKEDKKQKAIAYYRRAATIYKELSEKEPGKYLHYLATVYHNLGILFDAQKEYDKAWEHYEKAIDIRRQLAKKHPGFFNLDLTATLLNMLTLHLNLMESYADIKYKKPALQLLEEAKKLLEIYDENRPVVKSMKSDIGYFEDYFQNVDEEYLEILAVINKAAILEEKILETTVPAEKLQIQEEVLDDVLKAYNKYPRNSKIKNKLLQSCIDYAWYALRSNETDKAEEAIRKGFELDRHHLILQTNLAHLHLLKGETDKAKEIYLNIYHLKNEQNEIISNVIDKDLRQLKIDGVLNTDEEEINEILNKIKYPG